MLKSSILTTYNFPARALRNLGTFNTNYMDEHARDIFLHYTAINAIDNHAYPELEFIKQQCAEFLLNLLHAHDKNNFRYFTTSGSSEAVLLAMLVLKKHYQCSHNSTTRSASILTHNKPNIIIGANSHIAWHKAARYLEIELRVANINHLSLTIDNEQIISLIDANTIGVCSTLGAPTTLLCDDVLDLNNKLVKHYQNTGQFIPIHVDAASGGFVFPFSNPDLIFDFRVQHVISINISSHKYGLIYPSLGWLFIRYHDCIDELLDENDYLGTTIKCFSMQFSHSAAHLMTQYYYIKTLGKNGYTKIMSSLFTYANTLTQNLIFTQKDIQFITGNTAHPQAVSASAHNRPLRKRAEESGLQEDAKRGAAVYTLVHENSSTASTKPATASAEFTKKSNASLPGLIFTMPNIKMNTLSAKLKEKNWYLPVYTLPGATSGLKVARIVIRYGYDAELIDNLVSDILCVSGENAKKTAFSPQNYLALK